MSADDQKALDIAFGGEPFVQLGSGGTTLDIAYEGQPFSATDASAPAIDCAVATTQAQSAAATAQVQSPDAAATSQAQTTAATASVSIAATASGSQAQTASAALSAYRPWTYVRHETRANLGAATTFAMTAAPLAAGDHSLVCVSWRPVDAVNVVSVTDSAGNTYTPAARQDWTVSLTTNHVQWFYCLNAPNGAGSNVVTVEFDAAVTPALHAVQLASPAGIGAALDIESFKANAGNSYSVTTGAFATASTGAIVAAACTHFGDVAAAAFSAGYTTHAGEARSDGEYYESFGYRLTDGSASGQTVTATGDAFTVRSISVLALKETLYTGSTASTTQAQTTSGSFSLGEPPTTAATSQAQSSSASAGVAIAATVATSQAQRSAASTANAASVSAATSQAQSSGAAASISIAAQSTSAQAQQASGALLAQTVAQAATAQAQQTSATLGAGVDATAGTSQAQTGSAAAGLAIDATVAGAQAQSSTADAVAAHELVAQTAQAQASQGAAGLSVDAQVATRQGQRVRASGGGIIRLDVETAQAQHVGNSTFLSVGVDAAITTAQAGQTAAGTLEQYVPSLGVLSARLSVRCKVGGGAAIREALTARITTRGAVAGTVESRPL